jgi:hypothetical protein
MLCLYQEETLKTALLNISLSNVVDSGTTFSFHTQGPVIAEVCEKQETTFVSL